MASSQLVTVATLGVQWKAFLGAPGSVSQNIKKAVYSRVES